MEERRNSRPMVHDPLIIPRVKQYLEENVHQTYVDVSVMARHLQDKYRDYARRKQGPFRALVDHAYKLVLHSYGLDSNPSSEDDGNSDLEVMEAIPEQNLMSSIMNNMYAPGEKTPIVNSTIDISSDDEGEGSSKKQTPAPAPAPAPAPSTNHAQIGNNTIRLSREIVVTKRTLNELEQGTSHTESAPFPSPPRHQQPPKKRKMEAAKVEEERTTNGREPPAPSTKLSKRSKREFQMRYSNIDFKNVGGLEKTLGELCELLMHIKHPEIYKRIGLPPPRGFLLHGAPGTGKTLLAQAIAGQLNVGLIQVAATELISGVSGESEERLRELFDQAANSAPCVLFIDEIDAISANRVNASKDMERRIVAQLLICLDGLSKYPKGSQVLVIGATNRVDSLDPALRRVGRFDQEITLGIPDRDARSKILQIICKDLQLEQPFNFDEIAALTPGYVGADLLALAMRASSLAIKRAYKIKQELAVKSSFNRPRKQREIKINFTDNFLSEIDSVLQSNAFDSDSKEPTKDKDSSSDKTSDTVNLSNGSGEIVEITDVAENAPKVDGEAMETDEPKIVEPLEKATTPTEAVDEATKELTPTDAVNEPTTAATPTDAADEPIKASTPTDGVDESPSALATSDESKTTEVSPEKSEKSDSSLSIESKSVSTDDKGSPSTVECIQIDDSDTNTNSLQTAMLQNNEIKATLGLDVMIKWLTTTEPLISENELANLFITNNDFKEASKVLQPSAKREGFITVPDVTWEDIGSLQDIRHELQLAILAPVKYPNRLKVLGLQAPSGVLLCGPPGCGKTLLAKAVANEAGINFISVKGPELLNMYVGESERAVRQCFQRARNSAPCVIFFDEFDALCPRRSDSSENTASSRVVNQLLTEMDGVEERRGVFLMAATNRPDMIDGAVLRPGRLDKILYVGLPEEQDRCEILTAITKNGTEPTFADDVNIAELAQLTDSYTGADLAGLVRQAALQSLKDSIAQSDANEVVVDADLKVGKNHFTKALRNLRPSVTKEDKARYEKLRQKYTVIAEQS